MWNDENDWRIAVERAADEMRRGRPVVIIAGGEALLALALEHVQPPVEAGGSLREGVAVLAAATASQLKLEAQSACVGIAARIVEVPGGWALPHMPSDTGLPAAQVVAPTPAMEAAQALSRLSGLAPAVLVSALQAGEERGLLTVEAEAVMRYRALRPALERVTPQAVRLPIAESEAATLTAYRDRLTQATHLAIRLGEWAGDPLVRLHSSCLTGDVLGSLRCECGDQLHAAMAAISKEGGVLLYLNQEGRGIGLANKLRAYGLQDQGLDTVDANLMLGFAPDERDFSVAAQMLGALGIRSLRLLTNNPAKVAALEEAGIRVSGRVALKVGEGAHNRHYLDTKAKRLNHLF